MIEEHITSIYQIIIPKMNTGIQSWRVTPATLSIHLYLPGVDHPRVEQRGRNIHVTGSNDNYGVSYNYVVPLHPDSRDTVRYTFHQGLLVIDTDNINNVTQVLPNPRVVHPGVNQALPPAGAV